jgi:hypothetical protein
MIARSKQRRNRARAIRWLLALVLVGGAFLAWRQQVIVPGTGGIRPIGWSSPTPPPTSLPGATRDVALWPFQSHSPWNTPLAKTATFAGRDTSCTRDLTDPTQTVYLSTRTWSHAVFIAKPTDPWAVVSYDPAYKSRTGYIATIRIPTNATPSPPPADQGGDSRMYIIDPTHHYVDEMWRATKNPDGSWRTWYFKRNDLSSSGIGQGGTRPYRGSGIGGLIRVGELTHGIHHALAIAAPTAKFMPDAWVWPAIATNATPAQAFGSLKMGQLAAIPSQIDVTKLGLSPQGLVLAYAMQDYGVYLVETSENYGYYGDTPVYQELDNTAVNHHDLPLLHDLLECVTNNTADTVGGGMPSAPRMAPWAPWLPTEPRHP